MKTKLFRRLLVSTVPMLAGCYPRYTLVQPALTLTVRDSSGEAVPDAAVFFVAGSNPHQMLHHKDMYLTDGNGVVELESRRKWELVAPIVPHGVPFYYFAWCVEKGGYRSGHGYLSATDVWCSHQETVTLDRGEGNDECRKGYEQLHFAGAPQPTATAGPLPPEKLRQ